MSLLANTTKWNLVRRFKKGKCNCLNQIWKGFPLLVFNDRSGTTMATGARDFSNYEASGLPWLEFREESMGSFIHLAVTDNRLLPKPSPETTVISNWASDNKSKFIGKRWENKKRVHEFPGHSSFFSKSGFCWPYTSGLFSLQSGILMAF